jgi:hypothetical protein
MQEILVTASVLVLTAFLFNGCINQPPSQLGKNQTGTITELKPAIVVAAECRTTPIYLGHNTNIAGLEGVPWMKAEPSSSGIIGYLFFAGPEASKNQTYQPLHTGGRYPDGRSTKILWVIDNPHASNSIEITGKQLSAGHETFQQSFPVASSPAGNYPSIVNVPTSGCWQLQLKSGHTTLILEERKAQEPTPEQLPMKEWFNTLFPCFSIRLRCRCQAHSTQPRSLLTGRLWVRSVVLEGQDGPNQQERGSKERPPARNKEKRDARHRQQHRSHDGSEHCHYRADKPDQDDKQTEKEVRRATCDPGDSA